MIIIYHSRDLDGHTSGAILKKKFPLAQLIGYDYGQPVPELLPGEDIIMVDVSFPMDTLYKVAAESRTFVWIDHHISAINEFYKCTAPPPQLTAILQDGIAACEIAWNWAFPGQEMPYTITLLGMYDTWRNQDLNLWNEQIMPFQYGMRTMCKSPESFPSNLFHVQASYEVDDIIQLGKIILQYQDEQNAIAAKGAFEFIWKDYRVIAINGGGFNSNAFKSVYNPEKHDLMMPFKFDGKQWVFSIYTEKEIDCSELAKSMGGGGHKKAAGFQIKNVSDLAFPILSI